MNILIICHKWGYFAGREQYLIDTINELTLRGHLCSVVYGELTDKPITDSPAAPFQIFNLPNIHEFESLDDEKYVQLLRSIISHTKPDVVFFSDVMNYRLLLVLKEYGNAISMAYHQWLFCLRGTKAFYFSRNVCSNKLGIQCFFHGCFINKPALSFRNLKGFTKLQKLQNVLRIYKMMPCHLVRDQYMMDLFIQHGFNKEQVKIIGNYVLLPEQKVSAAHGDIPLILYLGRIDRYKGVDYLIRALAKLNCQYNCTIIGDGPYSKDCKTLAEKLGLGDKVHFSGWINREATKPYLHAAQVVIVPSIWPEPFGTVGLEAMACAKPVIAFNSGGIASWLHDGETGYLLRRKDITGLARKIEYLLEHPEQAQKMGSAGRHLAECEFNKDDHFDGLVRIFENATRG